MFSRDSDSDITDVFSKERQQGINELKSVVVDSGKSVTYVVPICSGYVLGSFQ